MRHAAAVMLNRENTACTSGLDYNIHVLTPSCCALCYIQHQQHKPNFTIKRTVNSFYHGHCRDMSWCPHLGQCATVRVYYSQISAIYFCLGFSCCPYYRGVCYNKVSTRQELTVCAVGRGRQVWVMSESRGSGLGG